jgi:hypothetical protein
MSTQLHLGSDLEQDRSVSLGAYLHETGCLPRPSSTGEEQAAAFLKWADSFPDVPVLSDEATSPASLYPDRW